MNECDEYEFSFDAYTPETIPMERLAKYMVALAKLLGHESSVHFDRLESGSTKQKMKIEQEASPKVLSRVESVGRGDAANDAMAGFHDLNILLKDDRAIGKLSRKPAGVEQSTVILQFVGRELPRPIRFGPFTEPASIDGELVKIGGKDKSAHATIIDPEGNSWSGELSRDLAQQIAPYLYKGPVLRVTGDAKWERWEDGAWHLLSLKIIAFEILEDDTLHDATSRLRNLRETNWVNIDDIDGLINASRGESDGLH